jgi:hypothetical protein
MHEDIISPAMGELMVQRNTCAKRRGWLRPLPKQIAGMPEAQAPFEIQEPIQIKLQFATNNKLDTSPDISSDNGVTQPAANRGC